MKKYLFIFLVGLLFSAMEATAQCDPSYTIEGDFTNRTQDPPCWSFINKTNGGISIDWSRNELWINLALANRNEPLGTAILPAALNARGTLTFDGEGERGFLAIPYDGIEIGVMEGNNFVPMHNLTYSGTKTSYSFSFSNYTGTGNKIYIRRSAVNKARLRISNLRYVSECPMQPEVVAKARNITVKLDYDGNATVTAAQINNSSTNICDQPIPVSSMSLSKTQFTCADLGENTVTLTAVDASGTVGSTTATVTVEPFLDLPAFERVYFDSVGNANVSISDVLGDSSTNCQGLTYNLDKTSFDCSERNFQSVNIVATNGTFRQEFRKQLRVLDTIAPIVILRDTTVFLDEVTASFVLTPEMLDNGSTDNCGIQTMAVSKSTFGCLDQGINEVTVTMTDSSGNATQATAIVNLSSSISDDLLTVDTSLFCPDGSTSFDAVVTLDSSVQGVTYLLRNQSANNGIVSTAVGNGSPIDFNLTGITSNSEYNILASKPASNDQALQLGNTSDRLSVDMPSGFKYDSAYTFEAWLKLDQTNLSSQHLTIFRVHNGNSSDIEVYVQASTRKLLVVHNRDNGVPTEFLEIDSVPDNEYFHLSIAFDGTTVKTFYNGVEQGSKAMAKPAITANSELTIGFFSNTSVFASQYFNETIDELRLWQGARTTTDILNDYQEFLTGTETDLLIYYDFEDPLSNSSIADKAGSNTGTISFAGSATQIVDGAIFEGTAACSRLLSTTVKVGDVESPVARGNNVSVNLGSSGSVMLDPKLADTLNASSDNCTDQASLIYSLSKPEFGCDDVGVNTVHLIIEDEAGNKDSVAIEVNVSFPVLQSDLSLTASNVCSGNPFTLSLDTSIVGYNYLLQDSSSNPLGGIKKGTGGALTFDVEGITSETQYTIQAGTPVGSQQAMSMSTTDRLDGLLPATFKYDSAYTVEAWLNIDFSEVATKHATIMRWHQGGSDLEVYIQAGTRQLAILHNRDNGATADFYRVTNVPENTFFHLAIAFDGNTSKAFINGVERNSAVVTKPKRSVNSLFTIGYFTNTRTFPQSQQAFNAVVDELRFWSTARTQAEISEYKDIQLTGVEKGLVSYFNFEGDFVTARRVVNKTNATDAFFNPSGIAAVDGVHASSGVCLIERATTITVPENQKPNAVAKDTVLVIAGAMTVQLDAALLNDGSSDECNDTDQLTYSLSKSSFDTTAIGDNEVYFIVEDLGGLKDSVLINVSVVEEPPHTISFQPIADRTYGDDRIALSATSSEGLPVNFSVISGPASIVGGGKLFDLQALAFVPTTGEYFLVIEGAGQITVQATQAGNDTIDAADPVSRTFTVNKAQLTISADDKNISVGEQPVFTASYNGFVNGDDFNDLTSLPTIGNGIPSSPAVGTYSITVDGAVSDNYTFVYEEGTLVVSTKTAQEISFPEISDRTYGAGRFSLSATSSQGLPITYTVIEGPAQLVSNGFILTRVIIDDANQLPTTPPNTLNITGAGQVTIEASQAGNTTIAPAVSVRRTFNVDKATLSITAEDKIITFGDSPQFTVSYAGFVNGENENNLLQQPTVGGSISTTPDAGEYTIEVNNASSDNYSFNYTSGKLTVNKANQTISFPIITDKDISEGPLTFDVTVSSGLALGSAVSGPATLNISGNQWTVTLNGAGQVVLTASQDGNSNYNAVSVTRTFVVTDPNDPCNAMTVTTESKTNTTAGSSNGAIDISVDGGTAPYTYAWNNGATTEDLTGLSSGVYSVIVKDNQGCSKSYETTVLACDLTAAIETTSPVIVGNDGAIDVAISGGTAPLNYAWSNGATTEDLQNVGAGQYTVTVTDSEGCEATTTGTVSDIITSLVKEEKSVSIYPNPANEILFIDLSSVQSTLSQVVLRSISGQVILSFKVSTYDQKTSIDLSAVTEGTYILDLILDKETVSEKISILKK